MTCPAMEPTFHPIGSLSNVMGDDLREPERDLPLDVALENAGSARPATSACRPFWERESE